MHVLLRMFLKLSVPPVIIKFAYEASFAFHLFHTIALSSKLILGLDFLLVQAQVW